MAGAATLWAPPNLHTCLIFSESYFLVIFFHIGLPPLYPADMEKWLPLPSTCDVYPSILALNLQASTFHSGCAFLNYPSHTPKTLPAHCSLRAREMAQQQPLGEDWVGGRCGAGEGQGRQLGC